MSDANNDVTGSHDTNPLTGSPVMSRLQPSNSTSSITAHIVHGELRDGNSEGPVTTLTDAESDNLNGQAEHGNGGTQGTAHGSALRRRRRPTLTILTPPRVAATDGQELGLGDLATGNDIQVPSAPTHGFDNPALFGVPQTNHHCRQDADNIENYGISSVADFSRLGEPASELSRPMERSTSSGTMAAPSSHPLAEGIDDGVSSEGVVLRGWPTAPDDEERGDRNTLAQDSLATPTNEVAAMNIGNSCPNTPINPANGSLPSSQTYPVSNSPIPSGRVEEVALDTMRRGVAGHLDPLFEERPSYAASVEGGRPVGHIALYGITVTRNVSQTVVDLRESWGECNGSGKNGGSR